MVQTLLVFNQKGNRTYKDYMTHNTLRFIDSYHDL